LKRALSVVTALILVFAVAGPVAAQAGGSVDASAAKKKKAKKKKKKAKKKAAVTLKDGSYTYVDERTRITEKAIVSGKGTKIQLAYTNFYLAEDCVQTLITYGTFPLKTSTANKLLRTFQSSPTNAYTIPVGPIAPDGLGGGLAETDGEINVKTLEFSFNFNLRMKNHNGSSSCFEFPDVSGTLKRAR